MRPEWNEDFIFPAGYVKPEKGVLVFNLYDWDMASKKDPLGVVHLLASNIASAGETFDKWLQIMDHKDPTKRGEGELHIVAAYGKPLPRPVVHSEPVRIR